MPSSTVWMDDLTMKLTKFERKRMDLLRKHEDEMRALELAERQERAKLIEPVIEKVTKVAAEEARKILEKSPELLEDYSFRKREAAKAISDALDALFRQAPGESEDGDDATSEDDVAPPTTSLNTAPEAMEPLSDLRDA